MMDSPLVRAISNPAQNFEVARTSRPEARGSNPAGAELPGGINFSDVLEALNPLKHMQGIGDIFRAVTGPMTGPMTGAEAGNEPGGLSNGVGSFLFSGNPGALLALAREKFGNPSTNPGNAPPAGDLAAMMAARLAARDVPVNPMEDGFSARVRFDRT